MIPKSDTLMSPAALEPLLRKTDVVRLLATTARTLDRLIAGARFPRATCFVGRGPRWSRELIEKFLRGEWTADEGSRARWSRSA